MMSQRRTTRWTAGAVMAAAVVALLLVFTTMASAQTTGETTLEVTLSTDGTCAPPGTNSILINGGDEVTFCYILTNDGDVPEVTGHDVQSSTNGQVLGPGVGPVLGSKESTQQLATKELAAFTVETASWSSFDQGGAEYIASATATISVCPVGAIHVRSGGTGSNPATWPGSYGDLQDALALARLCPSIDEILVAQGTYIPHPTDRNVAFDLVDGVTVQGGYSSSNPTTPNPALYPTILSGDLEDNDTAVVFGGDSSREDNSKTVVRSQGATTGQSKPLLRFVTVADSDGGPGLDASATNAWFDTIRLERNAATLTNGGGAILGSQTILSNSVVSNNWASYGSALVVSGQVLSTSIEQNNLVTTGEGAVFVPVGASPTFTNVAFVDNNASAVTLATGAIGITLLNVTISGNDGSYRNAAVGPQGNDLTPFVVIRNSIVWANYTDYADIHEGLDVDAEYSIFEGQTFVGLGNSSVDPQFISAANYRLSTTSPAANSGDNGAIPQDQFDIDFDGNLTERTPDLDGLDRITSATIDRGAYESNIAQVGARYVPLNPERILDTRDSVQGEYSTPWGSGQTRQVTVTGVGGVPASGVEAVVLNVTTVSPTSQFSWLTVSPTGETPATTAVHNFGRASFTTELVNDVVIAKVGAGGTIDIRNQDGNVDLVIDVVGYFATAGGFGYQGLDPARILDTRNSSEGEYSTPWGSGQTRQVTVTGVGGVPASGVEAVVLNVTTVSPTSQFSWLTVSPTGETPATTAVHNFGRASFTTELVNDVVIAKVGVGGTIDIRNQDGNVDLVIDVAGYFASAGGVGYTPQNPTRILDTRDTIQGDYSTPWSAGETRIVNSAASCQGLAVNITTVAPTAGLSWLTASASTATPGSTALHNFGTAAYTSEISNDLVLIDTAGTSGFKLRNEAGSVDIVVDQVGYFGDCG